MTIGLRVKELKKVLKITSLQMSQALSIPVRTIGSYERNEAQPGPKFLQSLFEIYHVNINWLIAGKGEMFISTKDEADISYLAKKCESLNLSQKELDGLISVLDSQASREMVLKFLQVKNGNKEALDSLISNLQGIKAIYG